MLIIILFIITLTILTIIKNCNKQKYEDFYSPFIIPPHNCLEDVFGVTRCYPITRMRQLTAWQL